MYYNSAADSALGMLGLAFLSKVANKHTIKKHR